MCEGSALGEGPLGLGGRACPRGKVRPPGFTEPVRIELLGPMGGGRVLYGWVRGYPCLNQTGLWRAYVVLSEPPSHPRSHWKGRKELWLPPAFGVSAEAQDGRAQVARAVFSPQPVEEPKAGMPASQRGSEKLGVGSWTLCS